MGLIRFIINPLMFFMYGSIFVIAMVVVPLRMNVIVIRLFSVLKLFRNNFCVKYKSVKNFN